MRFRVDFSIRNIALLNKGIALDDSRRPEEALAVSDELLDRFGASRHDALLDFVAQAFLVKATALGSLNRTEQAIAAYDEAVRRFGNRDTLDLLEKVAIALFDKGDILRRSNRLEEALAAYNEVVHRFAKHGTPFFLQHVAKALVNKSFLLVNLGRSEEALAVCDEVVNRFGTKDIPVLFEPVARILAYKARQLGKLNRNEEALATCDEALTRSEKLDSQEFNTVVQLALVEKAGLELKIGNFCAATETVDLLFDPHLKSSPENRSQGHLIRATANFALGDQSACEWDIQASLDLLSETGSLSKSYLDQLMLFCVRFGLERMHQLIQSSQAARLLSPLSTALELELGREPRVAVEVLEVAHDIRRRFAKLRKAQAPTKRSCSPCSAEHSEGM